MPGVRPAESCMRSAVPVPGVAQQVRMAAHGSPGQAGMAAAAAQARPAVLRYAGAVLAVTSGFDPSAPNMARIYGHWLGGKDAFPADRGEADRLLAIYPPPRDMGRENRAFIAEAAGGGDGKGIRPIGGEGPVPWRPGGSGPAAGDLPAAAGYGPREPGVHRRGRRVG